MPAESFCRSPQREFWHQSGIWWKRWPRNKIKLVLQPGERETLIQRPKIQEHVAKLETQYREKFVKSRVFTDNSLPYQWTMEKKEEEAHSLDAEKKKKGTKKNEKEIAQVLNNKLRREAVRMKLPS